MALDKSQSFREPVDFPKYSDAELDKFGEWLNQFRQEREISYPRKEVIRPINLNEAMVAFGAMKKHFVAGKPSYAILLEVMERGDNGSIKRYRQPTKYDLFNHKFDAWSSRQSKREFASKEELKHYDGLAKTMRVSAPESDDELS